MNNFIKEKSCLIKKIESTADGWILHPVNKDEKSIFISQKNYTGKMPPFFKWPWQDIKLDMTYIEDFQVSVSLNGNKLFEIPETDFPQSIKDYLSYMEGYEKEIEKAEEERQKEIKQALEKYFPSISIPQDIEKEISALAIPLRTYLQLHLFMGEDINYRKQRIALTLKLCEIAVRIYKRHVPETDILGTLDGAIRYRFTTIFPHYGHDVKKIEKSCQDDAMRKSLFADYYEVNRALKEFLPPVGNNLLNNYLNYTVRRILCIFSYDTDYLECHHIKDAWGNRILSDEMDYKRNYKEMKMPQFQSLILPEKFSDEQIADFIKNYSLR